METISIFLITTNIVFIIAIAALSLRLHKTAKALAYCHRQKQRQDIKSATIIESLPVGVEVYSHDGVLLSINNRDCEIFGVKKEDILNGNITIQDNPNLSQEVQEAFSKGERSYLNFPYDFKAVEKVGFYNTNLTEKKKRISCNGAAVKDSDGNMLNYIFIVDDITQQYNQKQLLEESIRLFHQALQVSGMVLWKYDCRTQLFSAYNDPVNNYDDNAKLSVEEYLSSIHPDDLNTTMEIVRKMNKGTEASLEFDFRVKTIYDTEWQNCIVTATSFTRDDNGKIIEYTGFKRNNTKWKKLNDSLKKVNIQNELILHNTNSGLIYITPDYKVQWENLSVCSASLSNNAYKKGEICYQSTFGRTTPCEDCVMQRAFQSKLTEQKKIEINGRILEVSAIPILTDENTTEGIVVRMDDITEHQRMISQLHEAKERAIQSDKLKSAFLANMSHEIRTPLNAIVGFADLLISTDDEGEKTEYCQIISNNNELLLRLINDILDLSKIEAGLIEKYPETFDLSGYFKELCITSRSRIKSPDIEFICDNPYPYCKVYMDKNQLTQIMQNYINNSIKYTSQGFIRIGYEVQDQGIRFYVSDSGIGIAKDRKHLIYQRFEKLNEFSQGTGLGLSIAKATTEANEGYVGFESEEGKGSSFWSWIPCETISFEKETNVHYVSSTQDITKNPKTLPDMAASNRKKILITEDIESNYNLIYSILHKKYDLTWATNGKIAVEKVTSESFDVIFMDMKMPVMNGMEATKCIRDINISIPIIALTAHAFDSDKEAALLGGCNDYLVKPVNKKLLLETIEKWI